MPTFAGVNHLSLTVSDLDVSEHFYTEVLDFIVVMDAGYGRICIHKSTGFFLSLIRHPAGTAAPFTELNTGLDHIGLTASTRDELVEWEQRFAAAGVTFTAIRDMELGHHLNFRDPDNIPLEFYVPNETMTAALRELRTRDLSRDEILTRAAQLVGATYRLGLGLDGHELRWPRVGRHNTPRRMGRPVLLVVPRGAGARLRHPTPAGRHGVGRG